MFIVADLVSFRVCNRKIIFLFLNQNICCGYSKEPSQWDGSFEHPKHMLKIMGKKIFTLYAENFCLSKPVFFLVTILFNVAELLIQWWYLTIWGHYGEHLQGSS